MFKKMLTLGLSLALASTMLVGCSNSSSGGDSENGSGKKVVLKMSVTTSDQSSWTMGANKFAELVKEKSNGEVEVKVYPNEQLSGGNQSKGVEMLKSGGIDISFHSNIIYSVLDERFSVVSLPWLIPDEATADEKLAGAGGESINKMLDEIGIVGLGFGENGFRQLTTTKKEIKSPEDMKGLKVRVPGMKMYISLFQALGADPISMNFSEVFTSLQQGAIDGQENPIDVINTSKLYEVQKNMSMWNYSYDALILGMNKAKFESLTESQQKAIKEAATEACKYQVELNRSSSEETMKMFKEKGMNIVPIDQIDIDAFKTLSEKVYTEYEGKIGKELIDSFK